MQTLKFNLDKKYGAFKPLNAVNGGPRHRRRKTNMHRSNIEDYTKARIPYTRNHDSGIVPIYGGPYSIDVDKIFTNFDADPNDPASYDFPCTDESILVPLEAGTKTFYRLGATIEQQVTKHATKPPKDLHKWAVICEHIIRHYTEGWANGFELDIEYWEIWNEPDTQTNDLPTSTWGGTKAQFFDMFEIAAKHLKGCFPHLKIGGPAIAFNLDWTAEFIAEMSKRNVPMDFFSWHIYTNLPEKVIIRANKIQQMLDENGYENTESILNEWNYVRGWIDDEFTYSIKTISNIKGACFTMAVMSLAQPSYIDMLMYYDARPSTWCGLFDFYTLEKRKPYYSFYWYGMFYDMEAEIRTDDHIDDIYSLCGCDKEGKTLHVLTYYTEDDDVTEEKTFTVDYGKKGEYEIYLLDADHDAELIKVTDDLTFTMKPNTMVLIKEK